MIIQRLITALHKVLLVIPLKQAACVNIPLVWDLEAMILLRSIQMVLKNFLNRYTEFQSLIVE